MQLETRQQLLDRYPRVVEELRHLVAREGLECADNFRVAKADDSWERAVYDQAASTGCCGSLNTTIKLDGIEYLIGCNYGH